MKINTTDKTWIERKVGQFESTAEFADSMDIEGASPETIRSVLTDLTRIVRDYIDDLKKS